MPRAISRDERRGRRRTTTRVFVQVLLGVLLLQSAWVLTIPPFRGLDEHDHAFKAAATARGDIGPHHEVSSQGWGSFMSVPKDIVVAAQPICESFAYTTHDSCRPGPETSPGQVRVATAMANTNPAFYFVMGTAARPFDGVGALYAMRVLAAVLSALVLALGFVALRRTARGPWLGASALVAMTPVAVYSTTVAAPNGLELASGFLVWSSLLCALRPGAADAEADRWVRVATAGAVLLVTLRALGPVWLLLIVVTVIAWAGWARVRTLLSRRNTVACIAAVGLATALAATWIVLARPNEIPGNNDDFDNPLWVVLPQQWVLWFFQSVGAIPARNEIMPMPVYMIVFTLWLCLSAIAIRQATRRQRLALGLVVALGSLVPLAATAYFYSSIGTAWQGRYALPYTIGFLLLCGSILDAKVQVGARWNRRIIGVAAALLVCAATICLVHVLRVQLDQSPLAGTGSWPAPAEWQVVALTAAGMALLASCILLSPSRSGVGSSSDGSRPGALDLDSPTGSPR